MSLLHGLDNIEKSGDQIVVAGTDLSLSQLVAELADGQEVEEVAEEYEVDEDACRAALEDLATLIERLEG